MAFLRKQLNGSQTRHRRVGIIGTVALVQRLGEATGDAADCDSSIGAPAWAMGEPSWPWPLACRRQTACHLGSLLGAWCSPWRCQLGLAPRTAAPCAAGRRYQEAMAQLQQTFQSVQCLPQTFAFLCDTLAKGIGRQAVGR